jgi:hypothetical protein
MAAMQSIATTETCAKQATDDLEDREISAAGQGFTVFTLSGHMKAEQVAELKELFDTDYRSIILDLQEMRLADRDAVKFLGSCERDGMKLDNCPAYVREWMDREED